MVFGFQVSVYEVFGDYGISKQKDSPLEGRNDLRWPDWLLLKKPLSGSSSISPGGTHNPQFPTKVDSVD